MRDLLGNTSNLTLQPRHKEEILRAYLSRSIFRLSISPVVVETRAPSKGLKMLGEWAQLNIAVVGGGIGTSHEPPSV